MNTDFESYDGVGLAELVRSGDVTPLELVDEVIRRIEAVQDTVSTVSIRYYEQAREAALAAAQQDLPNSPLAGVPWLLKDLLLMHEGTITSNSMTMLKDIPADHDSEFVRRGRAAGLILVAKTKVPEYGYCISTEPALWGPTRNPWNLEHVAGGSSGGSSAAVAARVAPFAHASDGGGSIRIPASWNGLVGLKVSRGFSTYAPDYADFWIGSAVEGCVSRTVRDTAAYADITIGGSIGDPYELPVEGAPYLALIEREPKSLRIGYTTSTRGVIALDPECATAVSEAAKLCEQLGHNVEEMTLDIDDKAIQSGFAALSAAEAAAAVSTLETLFGRTFGPDDFSRVNWQRIEQGRRTSSTDLIWAMESLRQIGRSIAQQCAAYDVVITPTMPTPAPKLGVFDMYTMDADPYNELLLAHICFTLPYNVSGQPALTLPLHQSEDNLPVGVQFAARRGADGLLLQLGQQIERMNDWSLRRAPFAVPL